MSSKDDVFLEEARLGPRTQVLVDCEEIPHIPRLVRRFREYVLVDLAHAVMLSETGILTKERGAKLLGGLLEVYDSDGEGFPWLPQSGSFLVQTEYYLGQRIGDDIAGRLQTGRSRNDQSAASERLYLRDLLLDVADETIRLQDAVLDQAARHAETLMPGYTHLQHAQPTTFGHHLMRYGAAFDRDLARLAGAFAHTNLSSLGGAAMAGTSWPVDRRLSAELLGHDDIVVNSSDAGGFARDFIEEVVAVLSQLMSNMGRLANDLYVWHSWEFGYVEVADGLAGTSSIMPQKKNPHSLERIKSLGGQAAGWLPGVMACQHSVVSTDLDFTFADDLLTGMGDATLQALQLSVETVATLIVHEDRMASAAGAFWSTTSHLADELVRHYDLPFRAAHHVVGRFVRDAIAAGHTPADVQAEDLTKAGREMADTEINLSTDDLRDILDARSFLTSRATEGSVHPDETRAHCGSLATALDNHRAQWSGRRHQTDRAIAALMDQARALAAK
ncbi:MAG: argininosuccinate lyase [Rhodospirillaceae bacterium]|jgi:argininosuccinate lyase|nr:argininosuccinate lyase [Rhodospirillaceae bacterium]MBT5297001.1 argininosuccinate lyase [Rhodospirillaceae bacterium]MBT5514057.1 argininosuccinate lyase [Rhodospirillaceae bacterium]MBT7247879.1 argininosuccinate lyase [Rhodospirillaceae bacterium]MBT7510181.1 argininosuccinate lyase [Rhodospirillaceae bacterium]